MQTLYDRDFHLWAKTMAELIRQGRFDQLDIDSLAEEVEDMGKSEARRIESYLKRLLHHLLKWQYQPDQQSNSWKASIRESRKEIWKTIKQNPSLQPYPAEILIESYEIAKIRAMGETGLSEEIFPETCPYPIDQVLDEQFWPG